MEYDSDRHEMVEFIPASTRRLLDVGCATGRFSALLRQAHPEMELWGIDPMPPPRDRNDSYQTRLVGSFPDDVGEGELFDCVVFNDVLEHMAEPWEVLRKTRALLTPEAVIVVSIPNVRHVSVLRPLIVDGRWDYQDSGILDRSHLRFFTRATAVDLLRSTGYTVERVEPLRWPDSGGGGALSLAKRLLRGRFDDFLAQQYAIVARPDPPSPP